MKKHLWYVVFDFVFESSQGMQSYSIPHEKVEGYITTEVASIDFLRDAITLTLTNQERLTQIREAKWLGQLL